MQSTRYLIVGGGMTGDMAAKGIREHDADGSIVLVGAEPHPPYKRPPLTKGLWKGGDEGKIWREPAEGIDLRVGRRIVALDLDGRRATDDAGEEYAWEKLLLATGAQPREIPGAEGVVYFRTLDDYRAVRAKATDGARFVVIGPSGSCSRIPLAAMSPVMPAPTMRYLVVCIFALFQETESSSSSARRLSCSSAQAGQPTRWARRPGTSASAGAPASSSST